MVPRGDWQRVQHARTRLGLEGQAQRRVNAGLRTKLVNAQCSRKQTPALKRDVLSRGGEEYLQWKDERTLVNLSSICISVVTTTDI